MCTLIWLYRPDHPMPFVMAHHRDERRDRPWLSPSAHWSDYPGVIGGYDQTAGGSWMSCHPQGRIAILLNRAGSLGPEPGKKTRGGLVLQAQRGANAAEAARQLATDLIPDDYRPFNLVIADREGVYLLCHRAMDQPMIWEQTRAGLHMISAHDLDDMTQSERLRVHLPRWQTLSSPGKPCHDWHQDPGWQAWVQALGSPDHQDYHPMAALSVNIAPHYGSLCASLLSLDQSNQIAWQFSPTAITQSEVPKFTNIKI